MVIKIEDYRIFMDGNGKIMDRDANQNDSINLINACGIRGFHSGRTKETDKINRKIMFNTYKTAFKSAKNGFIVFPAVGMGVWAGDPNVYWRAFLDAIIESGEEFTKIFINPGHRKSPDGKYEGYTGNELSEIIEEYKKQLLKDDNIKGLKNLEKSC